MTAKVLEMPTSASANDYVAWHLWSLIREHRLPAHRQMELVSIRKSTGVCGGSARIRNTRIAVWLLVNYRKMGANDQELLSMYPTLTPNDLKEAWLYYEQHRQEIDDAIALQNRAD